MKIEMFRPDGSLERVIDGTDDYVSNQYNLIMAQRLGRDNGFAKLGSELLPDKKNIEVKYSDGTKAIIYPEKEQS